MDPIAEARKRGEILLIIRMGNIDLDAKGTPALDAPNPFAGPGPGFGGPPPVPGALPGGLGPVPAPGIVPPPPPARTMPPTKLP